LLIDITGYIKFAVKQGVKNIDMIVLAIIIVNSADTVLSYVMYISAFVDIESLILCLQIFICFIHSLNSSIIPLCIFYWSILCKDNMEMITS